MIETTTLTGYIQKEETLSPLTAHTINRTFVLQVDHPFPGYYGQEMIDLKTPRSIIFITKNEISWEKILRLAVRVNEKLGTHVNLSKVSVKLWNMTYYGIRAKGFNNFDEILFVQEALSSHGVEFMKDVKMKGKATGLITLKKFFSIREEEKGIYSSTTRSDMAYVTIPSQLDWEAFRKHTNMIKNNISDSSYDVVTGTFYADGRIVDILRVFKPGIKISLLQELKEKYAIQIQRHA